MTQACSLATAPVIRSWWPISAPFRPIFKDWMSVCKESRDVCMASIEELLQARGGAVSSSAPREEPAASAPDSSTSSVDEDIDMNTTEFLVQERPMEAPAVADDVARRTRRAHGRVLRTLNNLS
ncbi:hypothetical protein PI124_g15975 [Phytophthora idaei]|nr:hypothetical protein PI125_g21487 [Phytophthora idaei]KAG3142463.1 hypothetical protein PI126_g15038 [Phytophthora idaei]KAG3239080.1 hypothetical protein PI124_g15975 [Phytophthora idaei]